MNEQYDYIVIGSGPAGYVSAVKAAGLGKKVLLVEKSPEKLGGVCLNEGCIPAKSLYHNAGIYKKVKTSPYVDGITFTSSHLREIVLKAKQTSDTLSKGLEYLLKKNGINIIFGTASFKNSSTLTVSNDEKEIDVDGEKILIASGGQSASLSGLSPVPGKIIYSKDVIVLENLPKKVLIVGGGAIGVEFADYFNALEVDVSIVEPEKNILPFEDEDVSKAMGMLLKKKGIKLHLNSLVKNVDATDTSVVTSITQNETEMIEEVDIVIVSAGRVPSTDDLNLAEVGVKINENGFILVDDGMRTSIDNIFAAGDVIPTPMLAHTGYAEGEIAALNAFNENYSPIDYTNVPNVVYSEIRSASIGLKEKDLKEKNITYKKAKHFFKSNGRAHAEDKTEGFVKVLIDENTNKFLGVSIVGALADEMIHEFAVAKQGGVTAGTFENIVHAHPTFSELSQDVVRAALGRSLHA